MNTNYPSISFVIIGLNCGPTLKECLESVKKCDYRNVKEIIYVDGGSKDNSIAIAEDIPGVTIIQLDLERPTAGIQRNAGWQQTSSEWVQFIDSDTTVAAEWLSEAVKYIRDDTAALFGILKERQPDKNIFHFIADLEWYKPIRNAKFFGGNVLIKRSVLEETNGYDETLIGGEDPELAVRVRHKGRHIIGIDRLMCYHDINMKNFKQYFKRTCRTGYIYAEAGAKMLRSGESEWFLKTAKIFVKAIFILLLLLIGIFHAFHSAIALAVVINFFPFLKIAYFMKRLKIGFVKAVLYAAHCSLAVWPQFFGILQFLFLKSRCTC